jgi:hypothetical protein
VSADVEVVPAVDENADEIKHDDGDLELGVAPRAARHPLEPVVKFGP